MKPSRTRFSVPECTAGIGSVNKFRQLAWVFGKAPIGAADCSPRREPWGRSDKHSIDSPVRGDSKVAMTGARLLPPLNGALSFPAHPVPRDAARGLWSFAPSGAFPKTQASCQNLLTDPIPAGHCGKENLFCLVSHFGWFYTSAFIVRLCAIQFRKQKQRHK